MFNLFLQLELLLFHDFKTIKLIFGVFYFNSALANRCTPKPYGFTNHVILYFSCMKAHESHMSLQFVLDHLD